MPEPRQHRPLSVARQLLILQLVVFTVMVVAAGACSSSTNAVRRTGQRAEK